jgi:hypothetical protein
LVAHDATGAPYFAIVALPRRNIKERQQNKKK